MISQVLDKQFRFREVRVQNKKPSETRSDSADSAEGPPKKRGRGRPPGSKTKPRIRKKKVGQRLLSRQSAEEDLWKGYCERS